MIGVPVIVVPIIVFLQFSDSLIVSVLEAWQGVWNGGRHETDPTHPLFKSDVIHWCHVA
jgi:hypothetical protein